MENKKITMVAMAIISVVAFAIAYAFVVRKQENGTTKDASSQQRIILPQADYDYESDPRTMDVALERGDAAICNYIKEDGYKKLCVATVQDSVAYKKAAEEMNVDMCDQVKNREAMNSCKNAVQGKIDYIKNNKE
jgi:hypothetical protein